MKEECYICGRLDSELNPLIRFTFDGESFGDPFCETCINPKIVEHIRDKRGGALQKVYGRPAFHANSVRR